MESPFAGSENQAIADVFTGNTRLACHPTVFFSFSIPYLAYDDGSANVKTIEVERTCPVCETEYIGSNVGPSFLLAPRPAGVPLPTAFAALRERISSETHVGSHTKE
jgi:hypothetical protein